MKITLGYVSIALKMPNITTSSTVTYSHYKKLKEEEKLTKLINVSRSNLNSLYSILKYNIKNNITFYRMTSSLIPLATHPEVFFNYREIFYKYFSYIGEYINANNIRIDTHPDHFNVINSLNSKVVEDTKRNLLFHVNLFEDLNYKKGKMILHVGSKSGGIEESSNRFIKNFKSYPKDITSKIILENDDKSFTALDTLKICETLKIPMVFDYHHHKCNPCSDNLYNILNKFINTWENEELNPKIHFSSPRENKLDRKHADFINAIEFANFLEVCKIFNTDLDIMLEAKMKDLSLFKLVKDIKRLRPNWKFINESTFLV